MMTLDGFAATYRWHVEQRKWVLTVYLDPVPVEAMEAQQRRVTRPTLHLDLLAGMAGIIHSLSF